MGLGGVNALRADGEDADGVANAVEFIAELRQASDLSGLPVGRRVVVIGGGMTAIDAAVQSKLLGAEEVTICYRRGQEHMNASGFEQDLAAANGVTIRHWLQPKRVIAEGGKVSAIELEYTAMNGDRLAGTGETLTLVADQVFKAIGQSFVPAALNGSGASIELEGGRIKVDAEGPHVAGQGLGRRRLHLRRRRSDGLGRGAGPRRGGEHQQESDAGIGTMATVEPGIARHYEVSDLEQRILAALADSGVDIANLRASDLEAVDEFHIGGVVATRELRRPDGAEARVQASRHRVGRRRSGPLCRHRSGLPMSPASI